MLREAFSDVITAVSANTSWVDGAAKKPFGKQFKKIVRLTSIKLMRENGVCATGF